jgi:predicted RNase H-like HicB family nuclease
MELPPLTVIIEPGEDGWLVARCPELDIVSQGETEEHAEAMIREAVELWLECATDEEVSARLQTARVSVKPLRLSHA